MVKKQCKNKWKTAKDGIKSVRADLADILKGKVERYYFVNSQRKPCFFYCGCKLFSNLRRLLVGGLLSFLPQVSLQNSQSLAPFSSLTLQEYTNSDVAINLKGV